MMDQARILIVEDEKIIALDIQRRMEGLGYQVVGRAASGEEAIQLAQALHPDLILMDIHLKGEMDGLQAAEQIRAELDVAVIFLTAFADRATLEQAGKTGAFGYVLKPFDDCELAIQIEMALFKHTSERERRKMTEELARKNAFVMALSQVAGQVEASPDLQQVLSVLSEELSKLELNCALGLLEESSGQIVLDAGAVRPGFRQRLETLFGVPVREVPIPTQFYRGEDGVPERKMLFFPEISTLIATYFPMLAITAPDGMLAQRCGKLSGPFASLPLAAGQQMVGLMFVWGSGLRQEDIQPLSVFAGQVAWVIEKTRLIGTLQNQARELNTLRQAAIEMTAAIELGQVVERVLAQLENVVRYDSAALFLVEGDQLVLNAGRGFQRLEPFMGKNLPGSNPLFLQIQQAKTPLILADASQEPRFQKWGDAEAVRGWMGIPLLDHGEVVGLLTVDSKTPGAYGEGEAALALALASQASIAIQNARLFQQVQNLAITDPLTGLYNRRRFFDLAGLEFDRSRRYRHPLSLLMIDMDFFKQVNDAYGHLVGDRVLQEVARWIRETLREVDILARYGGEEFIILLPETGCDLAYQAAERLRQSIARRAVMLENRAVRVTASIGLACIDPACTDVQALLNRADQALYAAKQAGRNRVAVG